MKTTNKILLTTIAVSLIACGGSSSSKGSSISTTQTPTTKTTKAQKEDKARKEAKKREKAKKREEARVEREKVIKAADERLIDLDNNDISTPNFEQVTKDFKVQGVIIIDDFNTNKSSNQAYASDTKESDIHSVIIGGKKIHLISTKGDELFHDAGTEEGVNKIMLSPLKYKQSHFVILEKGNKLYFISQGDKVEDMPVTGIAKYEGDLNNSSLIKDETGFTKVVFDVDFGGKTIKGSLPEAVMSIESKLKGSIIGNRFENKDKSFLGSFYGKNANELGGVYLDEKNSAVFGAKKK